MRWMGVLFTVLVLVIIAMLVIYYFVPSGVVEFNPDLVSSNASASSDFLTGDSYEGMQFYSNMRYQDKIITYRIDDACSLKKKNDMVEAFSIISDLTNLGFNEVPYGEEITVSCSNENIVSGNTFVAGEGGVTEVTVVGNYHIIFEGKILLIRDSECPRPNVAIHELLHALGFNHSDNPNNIMYEILDCDQTVGEDIPALINELYSAKSVPDLSFEEVDVFMEGRYLNANISIRNNGFGDAPASKIVVYADDSQIKEIEVNEVAIGYGRKISLSNLFINQLSVDEIKLEIVSDFEELDKTNNVYRLSVN